MWRTDLMGAFAGIDRERIVFGLVLVLAPYLSVYRSLVTHSRYPSSRRLDDQMLTEVAYWLVALLLIFWLLIRERSLQPYFRKLLDQPALLLFLAICLLSAIWSSDPAATVYHTYVLIAATAVAAYIGTRFCPDELLTYTAWLAVVTSVANVCTVMLNPLAGIDWAYGPTVWRGIFWNKNHTGSMAAMFASLLLLRLIGYRSLQGRIALPIFAVGYVLCIAVVVMSRSATGGLVALALHAMVLSVHFWVLFESRLRRGHYMLLLLLLVALSVVALVNLGAIFGVFGKDFTLSGRLGLWAYLLQSVVGESPYLGHGFGALWGDPAFRAKANDALGLIPLIADNGFMDVVMGVGIAGLGVFVLLYLKTWRESLRHLLKEKTIPAGMPVIFLSFALLANTTFSLLTEIEVLVWSLMVAVLISTSRANRLEADPSRFD
jgi:exopolysaccharide production protein ExoQ